MSYLHAILFGLIQGVTWFLPVSSDAHLRVVSALAHWPDPGAPFTAVMQLGSLVAMLVYFRDDLVKLTLGAVRGLKDGHPLESPESRLAFGILVGTVPIGVFGVLFKHEIEGKLRSVYVIAGGLIVLALVLFVAEKVARHQRDMAQMTFKDAVVVGFWQVLALVPGCSRSGSTITGGLFLGLERETAARFSFLLGIPATAAAGLFEARKAFQTTALGHSLVGPTVVATLVALVTGMAVIAVLLKFLQTHSTMVFVVWRLVLGLGLLALLFLHVIPA